jgi:hypothetical protein
MQRRTRQVPATLEAVLNSKIIKSKEFSEKQTNTDVIPPGVGDGKRI